MDLLKRTEFVLSLLRTMAKDLWIENKRSKSLTIEEAIKVIEAQRDTINDLYQRMRKE